ncbi:MAG: hypothetical protein II126_01950, partial [Erysipelotrichaceae bacterium]|nr:hypothetical protein [Erysipelotrichaceae bacterium]
MSFFKETKAAIIVMLAVILGSSTISAVGSINKAVTKLNDQFYKGQGDNLCIYEDIIDKTEYAYEIYQTAIKSGNSDKEVEKISSLIQDIKKEKSIKKLYSLMQNLDSAVDYTVTLLSSKNISSTQNYYIPHIQKDRPEAPIDDR